MNVMRSVEVLINSKTAFEMEEIYLSLVPTSSKGKTRQKCLLHQIVFQIGSDEYEVKWKLAVVMSVSIFYIFFMFLSLFCQE